MNNLYKKLDKTKELEDRRKIISDYLKSQDISTLLPEGSYLSDETRFPFEDNKISIPFLVGNKYLRDEPYCDHKCPVYILGIVHTPKTVELLLVEPDEESVSCLPRDWMEEPSDLIN